MITPPCLSKPLFLLSVFTGVILLFPPSASAYLDPGTGSYIAQIVIASLVGVGFFFGNLKTKLMYLISRLLKPNSASDHGQKK